jgi:hypothetical protein
MQNGELRIQGDEMALRELASRHVADASPLLHERWMEAVRKGLDKHFAPIAAMPAKQRVWVAASSKRWARLFRDLVLPTPKEIQGAASAPEDTLDRREAAS